MKSILVALTMLVLVIGVMSLVASLRFFAGTNTGDIAASAIGLFVGGFLLFAGGGMLSDLIVDGQPRHRLDGDFFTIEGPRTEGLKGQVEGVTSNETEDMYEWKELAAAPAVPLIGQSRKTPTVFRRFSDRADCLAAGFSPLGFYGSGAKLTRGQRTI